MFIRVSDLGQLDFFGSVLGAAITAAGSVGSAFIGADAQKYAARQQKSASVLVALSQEKAALETAKAQELTANVSAQEGTQQTVAVTGALNTFIVAGTILAFVGIAAYVALKE